MKKLVFHSGQIKEAMEHFNVYLTGIEGTDKNHFVSSDGKYSIHSHSCIYDEFAYPLASNEPVNAKMSDFK